MQAPKYVAVFCLTPFSIGTPESRWFTVSRRQQDRHWHPHAHSHTRQEFHQEWPLNLPCLKGSPRKFATAPDPVEHRSRFRFYSSKIMAASSEDRSSKSSANSIGRIEHYTSAFLSYPIDQLFLSSVIVKTKSWGGAF